MTQVHKLQGLQMKQKDCRIKLLTEILNGIKVLKLYAWELLFKEKILSIRETELKILWKASIIGIGFTFSWTVAPYIVSLATFTTYIFTSATHYLDAQTAFVAISFFNILRFAINFAPMAISEAIKASVSLKRLNKFLRHEELDPDNVINDNLQEEAITVEDGKFLWDIEAGTSLKNIHLSIPEKSLVAIVGPVGCGKSSLISALLGDMIKVKGSVNVKGTKAYVPQQPWIQNGTLQDNILFGRDIDHECYNRVIDACALRPDIDILNNGDQTFIGEKGINLSGGQKQRVSLARAVYHNTDIYLLDDPLSAVDSHVGKHIFEHVIGKNGVLKDKTRVLVTHGLRWLPYVDNIIVMVNGTVIETGTYDDLLSSNGTFSNVLKIHMTEMEIKDDQESSNKIWKKVKFDLYDVENEKNLEKTRLLQTNLENIPTMQMAEISVHKGHLHRIKSKYQLMLMHEKPSVQDIKSITEEKIEEGNVRIQVFITYARALGVSYTMIIMFFYACYQTSSVFSSLWLSQWTSDALLTNRTLGSPDSSIYRQRNDYYLGIYGGAGIAQAIFVLSYVGLFVSRSISASHLLHQKMVHSIVRSPMSFFDLTPIGRIINRFSADIDTVDNVLPLTVEMWLDCVFAVIATLIVICYSTPIFLVTILPLAVVYFFVQRFYVSTSRQLRRLEAQSRSPLYNHFGETISGASVIRAFDAEDRFIKISDDRVDLNQKFSFARIGANRWLGIRLEFLGNIVIFAAAMFAVLARGHIDGAMVGLSVTYALQITGTLNWLVRMTSDLETNIVAVERIQEYTGLKHEADLIGDYRPSVKWPQKGCVNFKNYSTKYRDDLDLVLKDITTTIHGGEKVGIVGRTGAGKSSLTLAMFRLVEPVSGSIMIDGEDLSRMGLHDCRSKLTILPQDPVLFSGSLKMNLDPQDQHSDEDIWQALEHAHLKDFLLDSSQNLEFDCGEGGQNLSIGQRQLVCLARSLLKNTKLLILDEATAAIDLETDDLIQHTIHKTFRDCTVITIAHRLHTVINYDRIMVLDEGEIREFDTPDRLLQNTEGLFYQLAQDAGII